MSGLKSHQLTIADATGADQPCSRDVDGQLGGPAHGAPLLTPGLAVLVLASSYAQIWISDLSLHDCILRLHTCDSRDVTIKHQVITWSSLLK